MVATEPDDEEQAVHVNSGWWVWNSREGHLGGESFAKLECISRDLSYHLRHDPHVHVDKEGAVDIEEALRWFKRRVDVEMLYRAMQPKGQKQSKIRSLYY